MRLLKSDVSYKLAMWLIIIISMIVAVLFCYKKQGFHYDENYSYYSTNITVGLWPTDNEWKDVNEIRSEFKVLEDETLNLGLVKVNQSYDVHPPLYYYVLRVVCFLTKNTFSKWQGLIVNLVFYFVTLILLWKIADVASDNDKYTGIFTLILFGLSPGYLSTITFIRMYSMLTMECFAVLLIAMKALKNKKWTWKGVFIPTMLITLLGFLTHYYYMVFVFFVAAFVCLYLVFHKETRIQAFIYGGSVCLGLILAVLYYPSCLSHIFSGYRGNEATQAFADVSNTWSRFNFFLQMLNDYTFSGVFYILFLVAVLVYMFYAYKRKISIAKRIAREEIAEKTNIAVSSAISSQLWLLITVAIGFFFLVSKTGMMPSNPAEALRYECPSFGLIILLVVLGIMRVFNSVSSKRLIPVIILTIAVAFQINGLCSDKVFFLYEEDVEHYSFAKEHNQDRIVFIYNPVNSWMIWKDSEELMEYEKIFFISMNNEDDITDSELGNADKVYVYACRSDNSENIIGKIISNSNNLNSYEKVGERLFVDIFEIK